MPAEPPYGPGCASDDQGIYLGPPSRACRVAPDADELGLGATHPVPLDDARRMANDGTIEDATTLIALYRYSGMARG